MNLHTLLTKHQIVHGLENDQAHIDAFVKELTELQLNMPVLQDEDMEKILAPGEKVNRREYALFLSTRNYLRKHIRIAIKLMGGRDE